MEKRAEEYLIKEVKGYEDYLVDTNGIVYRKRDMHIMCQWIDNTGYKQCNVKKDKKKYYKRIHRLVAETFIPNPNNLPEVNHIDGNKTNNKVSNLEWVTNSENTKHGYDNNAYKFKTRSYPVNVYDLKNNFIKQFPSIRSLCNELKLNRKTISAILNNGKENNYTYIFKYKVEDKESR